VSCGSLASSATSVEVEVAHILSCVRLLLLALAAARCASPPAGTSRASSAASSDTVVSLDSCECSESLSEAAEPCVAASSASGPVSCLSADLPSAATSSGSEFECAWVGTAGVPRAAASPAPVLVPIPTRLPTRVSPFASPQSQAWCTGVGLAAVAASPVSECLPELTSDTDAAGSASEHSSSAAASDTEPDSSSWEPPLVPAVPSMQPAETLHRYVTGLKPAIKQHVLIANPPTVEDAMALADRVDQAAFGVRPMFGARFRPVNGQGYGGPVPMEIGAMQPAPPGRVRTPLTPQLREYLMRNNGCFYCRQLGHTAQQCRLLSRNQRPGQRVPVRSGNGRGRSY
jgi:hypothetical protein